MEFFRDGRAADDRAALEHRHLQPGLGQIGGADEAVVPPSDDDGVGFDQA